MEKRKLKVTLGVLNEVSVECMETKKFRTEMSQRKYISGRDHLFSFYKPRSKELTQETFFIVYC